MANQVRTTFRVDTAAAINQLRNYQTQLRNTINLQNQVTQGSGAGGGTGPGGGGGGNPLEMSFGPLGRMLGFASAGAAVSVALTKTVEAYQAAIDKTIAAEKANRLLASSALEAGKSYGYLAEQNRQFAKQVGLSATQAANTTAQITRLAVYAGNASEQQIEKLLQSFADLGAARGVSSRDLETLIGTILSGQDEGLNRLGISDPGQLQKAYAVEIGKTVDQLTQFEKVQAAVNAVVDKASLYTGAAADRMEGFEGSIARAEAAWANFTEALAGALVNNPEFMQTVNTLTLLLNQMAGFQGANVQETIANAIVEPLRLEDIDKVIAAEDKFQKLLEETRKKGMRTIDASWTGVSLPGRTSSLTARANWWLSRMTGDEQAMMAADQGMFISSKAVLEEEAIWKERHRKIRQQHQAAIKAEEDYRAKIQEVRKKAADDLKQQFELEKVYRDYGFRIAEAQIKAQFADSKTAELAQLKQMTELRRQELEQQKADAVRYRVMMITTGGLSAQDELQLRKDSAKEIARINQEIRLAEINGQAEIQRKEREVAEERKKNLQSLQDMIVSGLSTRTQNPFVKIFDDTAKAIERVKETTKDLGDNFRRLGEEAVKQLGAYNLYSQRIQSSLQAVDLQISAEDILSAGSERRERLAEIEQDRQRSLRGMNRRDRQAAIERFRIEDERRQREEKRIQERVDRRLDAVYRTQVPANLSQAEAQRLRDQGVIRATEGVDYTKLREDQRREAAAARQRESEAVLREETKARRDLAEIREAVQTGLLVKLAPGYENIVRIVDQTSGKVEIKSNFTGATTNTVYGN